jgi:hypothetical protein
MGITVNFLEWTWPSKYHITHVIHLTLGEVTYRIKIDLLSLGKIVFGIDELRENQMANQE